jgi:hypothetical protein
VEVKIGVADSPRELTVSTGNSQGMLTLVDDKGRRYMVPTSRVAYIEIGPADSRRVGFAVGG